MQGLFANRALPLAVHAEQHIDAIRDSEKETDKENAPRENPSPNLRERQRVRERRGMLVVGRRWRFIGWGQAGRPQLRGRRHGRRRGSGTESAECRFGVRAERNGVERTVGATVRAVIDVLVEHAAAALACSGEPLVAINLSGHVFVPPVWRCHFGMLRIVVEAIGQAARNSRSACARERRGWTERRRVRKIWVISTSASIALVAWRT
ncbi:hypothetical protein [Paraburkholderia mimosarum]|uniref:hypothetical protein n=1 Tax=Paraburkholderia mimosarum TaxID=312026 RepID=UPI0012DC811A|nr:hypothetical protein [Paraburkholderia mimosarum]